MYHKVVSRGRFIIGAALLGVAASPSELWLTVKPTPLPGDRYELVGVVINLTGTGDCSRRCVLGTAEWTLRPVEVNVEALMDAEQTPKHRPGRCRLTLTINGLHYAVRPIVSQADVAKHASDEKTGDVVQDISR